MINGAMLQLCLLKFPLHSERGKVRRNIKVWKPKKKVKGDRSFDVRVVSTKSTRDRIRRTALELLKKYSIRKKI